jgi:hypothetical protein
VIDRFDRRRRAFAHRRGLRDLPTIVGRMSRRRAPWSLIRRAHPRAGEFADVVVIGTPMHNLTVPAALKAWIDHVVRARRTFTISAAGKVGTLRDRPVFVAIASGGRFSGERARQPDFPHAIPENDPRHDRASRLDVLLGRGNRSRFGGRRRRASLGAGRAGGPLPVSPGLVLLRMTARLPRCSGCDVASVAECREIGVIQSSASGASADIQVRTGRDRRPDRSYPAPRTRRPARQ